MSYPSDPARRGFLLRGAAVSGLALTGLAGILSAQRAPAIAADRSARCTAWGLQIGDVVDDRAIIWSRADRAVAPASSNGRATSLSPAALHAARPARARAQRLHRRASISPACRPTQDVFVRA